MKNNSVFLTIVVCILLVVVRVLAEFFSLQYSMVFIINAIAAAYVLWVILSNTYDYIKSKKNNNQFWKERYKRYVRFIKNFIAILFVIVIVHIVMIYKVNFIQKIAGCINDILAIITLGISIQDNKIVDTLKAHYENMT